MLTDENKKKILQSFLETIEWISDREYQRKAWIRGEILETDFDETVNFFFDDVDPILENYKGFRITDSQYQILKNFRDKFRMFSDNNNWPHQFIDTPEWHKVTEMAKEVLEAFDYKSQKKNK